MTTTPPPTANLRGAVDLSSLVHRTASDAGSESAAVSVPSLVVEGTDTNFTNILELSNTVPVIVQFHAGTPSPGLTNLVRGYAGRFLLTTVLASANPQLARAFNVVNTPTVAAVVGGRPIALYEGDLPDSETRAVLDQLAALAQQNGVTGTVAPQSDDTEPAAAAEPVEEPLPPHHQEAYEAIAAQDYATAIAEYKLAIAQNPRDELAVAGLAQVSLLQRLDGVDAQSVRDAAAAAPADVNAQLLVADLDVAGGHLDDAFDRLLGVFPSLDQTAKDLVRTRLLDYFEIAGTEDPRVAVARRRLTALLY
ncbi:tetratricopeptide repeat protein [Parafrigoribacterium mesophilum]|uniref:co-chaperone YbbN n=1 Tax=Parafrigoribacterium mesophilum TaxID=433646 RepID=UPI0031FBD39A